MVKKSLLAAAVLFGLYAFFIGHFRPQLSVSRQQWQDNQIRAEKYLYDNPGARRVLVGSSLSARLDPLPGVYNLALSGQSVLDGLAIVSAAGRPLETVYVEMNVLDRGEDHNFIQGLRNPILDRGRRMFLALRADKQPLSILAEKTQTALTPLVERLTPAAPAGAANPGGTALFAKMLDNQQRLYAAVPPELPANFAALRGYVQALRARGTRVVFYEMPVQAPLCRTAKADAIRAQFARQFPPAAYRYVALPACGDYQTMDGVHLNSESAARYTRYLQAHL
ncbi:hypothetical protein ACFQ48_00315 [Hymenobacter caeli]|uniref:SGNH/GDSL hydrolase family protein n=1 Tax=Hymenobacter caeli TaxID=2735894 RepID=A0ABX2FJG7_9BACT|nr:hypothetical protein [Hymenobacter caeli]NRT17260.1 hypothetical protein [Hymenobacter caeli]